MSELSLSMRVPLVASNELAIVTKSIAFVSPPRTTDNLAKGKEGVHLIKSSRRSTLVEEEQIHAKAGKFFGVLTLVFKYNIIKYTNISTLHVCVREDVFQTMANY